MNETPNTAEQAVPETPVQLDANGNLIVPVFVQTEEDKGAEDQPVNV